MTRSLLFLHARPGRRADLLRILEQLEVLTLIGGQHGLLDVEVATAVDDEDEVVIVGSWASPELHERWLAGPVPGRLLQEDRRPALDRAGQSRLPRRRVGQLKAPALHDAERPEPGDAAGEARRARPRRRRARRPCRRTAPPRRAPCSTGSERRSPRPRAGAAARRRRSRLRAPVRRQAPSRAVAGRPERALHRARLRRRARSSPCPCCRG